MFNDCGMGVKWGISESRETEGWLVRSLCSACPVGTTMSIVVGNWEDRRSKNHCAAVVGVDSCTHQTAFIEGTVDAEFVQLGAKETGLRASLSVT